MGGKRKNKNGPPLCSEGDKGGGGLTRTRASEAKGPFPGGKRVGSRGKKKNEKKEKSAGPAPADLHPPLNKKRWA